jgi:hypothetical protein
MHSSADKQSRHTHESLSQVLFEPASALVAGIWLAARDHRAIIGMKESFSGKETVMRTRTALFSVSVVLTLVIGVFAAASAQTASARGSVAPAQPATVSELAKVTLDETSINAPGFAADAQQGIGAVIAWAGTDPLHHINVITSSDGLHYGHKLTLDQQTINRPAIAREPASAGGAVALAWRGTDGFHTLNVLYDPYGVHGQPRQLVTAQTSFTTPAIAFFQGKLLLAWTGTDPNHSLNVLPIALPNPAFVPGTKTVLAQFSASAGPNLSVVKTGSTSGVVLSWATATGGLNLAQSSDGVHFTSALGSGLAETSPSSPNMIHFQSEGGPEFWIAWTGTDAAYHLNVKWTPTSSYPHWTGAKTILPESALGGPGLGFQEGLLIAWTGTDSTHHLNVARLQGS